MNKNAMYAGIVALMSAPNLALAQVSDSKVWAETYSVNAAGPRLVINNIWGSIRVRPGKTGEIAVTVDERRTAPDQERFDRSLEMLNVSIDADSEGVSIIVGEANREWRGRNRCRGCRVDYQFEVVVPPDALVDVGTVNDGRVDVAGITGSVSASNVNGPITVNELRNCNWIESVNGAVNLRFATTPSQDCNVETINGDITLGIPPDASMDVAFDLFNGRVTSEIDVDPLALPAKVERTLADGSYRYRIEQPSGVRLGSGGPTFSFTSLNGDVRILKNW